MCDHTERDWGGDTHLVNWSNGLAGLGIADSLVDILIITIGSRPTRLCAKQLEVLTPENEYVHSKLTHAHGTWCELELSGCKGSG